MNNNTAAHSRASPTTLSDLIASIDIVKFISRFVDLEQRGDEWWGKSCFKDEKTPSFSVRAEPPCFYDYSSGIAGNVFTFVRYYYHCGKREAVEILKQYAGIEGELAPQEQKMTATDVCKKYSGRARQKKPDKTTKLPEGCMDKYEVNDNKLAVWESEGISRASLDRFQIRYDPFANRLVYPIRSVNGTIVNVGGRTLDPAFKEKNLKKYCYYYAWGTMSTIYGLFENAEEIRKKREVILFEGCKSVLLADTWGIRNTGAILTSHLSPAQMKILAQLGCTVVFALDKDVDVRADRNVNVLKRYVNVLFLQDRDGLLDEKDAPVDKGKEVFDALYEHRIHL